MTRSKCKIALFTLLASVVMTALMASSAMAAWQPIVETRPATSIEGTTATVNGVVNPNGAETKYYFEYGTTQEYGSKTAEVAIGSGSSSIEVNKALTGLSSKTTYHFRVVASNSFGTSYGTDAVFGTTGSPTATTLAVANLTKTGATLKASINPHGLPTEYAFEYDSKATPWVSAGAGINTIEVGQTVTGLAEHTINDYYVVARNSKGLGGGAPDEKFLSTPPEFSLSSGTLIGSTFTLRGGSLLIDRAGANITCKAINGTGEITGTYEVTAKLTLENCEQGGLLCHSSGSLIKTEQLSGRLVYVSSEPKKIGLDLEGPGGTHSERSVFAKFSCATEPVELRGEWIGTLSPLNTLTQALTSTYSHSGATQEPDGYEGSSRSYLDELMWSTPLGSENVSLSGSLGVEQFASGGKSVEVEVKG